MFHLKNPLIFALLGLCFFGIPEVHAEKQFLDRVVAVINDEAITQSEIDIMLRPIFNQYKKDYQGDRLVDVLDQARRQLLNQLIEDRLVFQEAKEKKIEIDNVDVDKQMENFKKRFKGESELESVLKDEGMTLTTMRERLERQAMIRKLQDMEVRSKVVVSPMEVEKYYQEHPEEFKTTEAIQVRSLTIKKSDEARENGLTDEFAKAKIEELKEKITQGQDFSEIAKNYSEDMQAPSGGLSDWINRGDMIDVIDQKIFNLKVGEMTDLLETSMGYHVFRLEKKREARTISFEEAREDVYRLIYQQKIEKRFTEWMDELKSKAYISLR